MDRTKQQIEQTYIKIKNYVEERKKKLEELEAERERLKIELKKFSEFFEVSTEKTHSTSELKHAIIEVLMNNQGWMTSSSMADTIALRVWPDDRPKSYKVSIMQALKALADRGAILVRASKTGNKKLYHALESNNDAKIETETETEIQEMQEFI